MPVKRAYHICGMRTTYADVSCIYPTAADVLPVLPDRFGRGRHVLCINASNPVWHVRVGYSHYR